MPRRAAFETRALLFKRGELLLELGDPLVALVQGAASLQRDQKKEPSRKSLGLRMPALQFIAIVDEADGFKGRARIGHINRAVNFAIRAVEAGATGAARDDWTSPLQTLAAGEGDCKQYAVLKYAALQAAGFAADDLRIVIIIERRTGLAVHAVVAVRNDGRWLILDNRVLAITGAHELLDRYRPLYEFDRRGVRAFAPRPEVVAQKVACNG